MVSTRLKPLNACPRGPRAVGKGPIYSPCVSGNTALSRRGAWKTRHESSSAKAIAVSQATALSTSAPKTRAGRCDALIRFANVSSCSASGPNRVLTDRRIGGVVQTASHRRAGRRCILGPSAAASQLKCLLSKRKIPSLDCPMILGSSSG